MYWKKNWGTFIYLTNWQRCIRPASLPEVAYFLTCLRPNSVQFLFYVFCMYKNTLDERILSYGTQPKSHLGLWLVITQDHSGCPISHFTLVLTIFQNNWELFVFSFLGNYLSTQWPTHTFTSLRILWVYMLVCIKLYRNLIYGNLF